MIIASFDHMRTLVQETEGETKKRSTKFCRLTFPDSKARIESASTIRDSVMLQASKEATELQIADIDLLRAAYPGDEELEIDSSAVSNIEALRGWTLEESNGPRPTNIPTSISCILHIRVDTKSGERSIQLNIDFDLTCNNDMAEDAQTPPSKRPRVQLRQPDWMTKSVVVRIQSDMPEDADNILSMIEYIRDEVATYHNEIVQQQQQKMASSITTTADRQSLVRVWFSFPSLSTREKRDDLVNHAPSFGLTGFVLAGKPGLLCLEGQPGRIDAYMKFIKTESWRDIPSHHKKVSERYRETGDGVERHFGDMCEITDVLGKKRGERANRSDMKALEAWLVDRGLGRAFSHVLM